MRKSRSRSHEGTDDTQAQGPAGATPRLEAEGSQGEAGGPAPRADEGSAPNGAESEGSRRKRRRRRKGSNKPGENAAAEAPDAAPPEPGATPDSGEASKSRSKRRRERRAKARAASSDEGSPESRVPPETPRPPQSTRRRSGPPDQAPQQAPFQGNRDAGRRQAPERARRMQAPEGRDREGQYGRGKPQRRDRPGERGPDAGAGNRHRPRKSEAPETPFLPFPPADEGLELPPGIVGFDATGRPVFSRTNRPGSPKTSAAARTLETIAPSAESIAVLARLLEAIEEVAPLSAKHRAGLRGDIRQLWEELTSDREHRSADYLGTPPSLSAYLRYFLPWNVYRLSSILSNADFCLPEKAVIADIGSGPLTFPIALWASRPELRDLPLTIYCMDRVERVLEMGLAIFETLCMRMEGRLPPWKIVLVKEGFGAPLPERAHLLAAANVFNEFFWKDKSPLGERALAMARSLLGYLRENGSLFVMEPGDPRSASFISALRAALIAEGASPLGPCPHALSCPMPGIFRQLLPREETRQVKGDPNSAPSRFLLPPVIMPKKRDKFPWCHFGVDTDRAPSALRVLSEEAGLPKERAVLSYLWAARGVLARPLAAHGPVSGHPSEKERRARAGKGILVRVVSEPIALPDGTSGHYACSNLGYTLLKRPRGGEDFEPGDLLEIQAAPLQKNDEKSGAIILPT